MTSSSPRFAEAIGSKWLTYTPAYAWLLPLWFTASILSTRDLSGWEELLSVIGINVMALAGCYLEYLLFRETLWRESRTASTAIVPWWRVLVGGIVLGATKAIVTTLLSEQFLGSSSSDLTGRIVAGCLLGIALVLAMPVVLSQLEHYRAQRTLLISELVRREVASKHTTASRDELSEFITKTLSALQSVRSAPESLPAVLDDMRNNEIRPLSHKIWQREQDRIPDFTLSNLIGLSLSKMNFLVWSTVGIFAVIVGPTDLSGYGVVKGASALVIQCAIVAAGLGLAKLLPARGIAWGIAAFVFSALVIALAVQLITTFAIGQLPTYLPVQSFFQVFQFLLSIILVTGVISLTRRTHKSVADDLLALTPNLGVTQVQRAAQLRSDRELAQLLHSQVQNVFLAKAVMVRSQLSDVELSGAERAALLETTLAELEAYVAGLTSSPPKNGEATEPLVTVLARIQSTWTPGVSVSIAPLTLEELAQLQPLAQTLSSLLNEAISNAIRHGLARTVLINIEQDSRLIQITVDDDGFGPRNGAPGLGTFLYMSIPDSDWNLTSASPLGGARLRISMSHEFHRGFSPHIPSTHLLLE